MSNMESLMSLYKAQKNLLNSFDCIDHSPTCPMEDMDSVAPCNCGASDYIAVLESLRDLVDKNFKDKMAKV